ncbi:hypothetical protein CASFOL_042505 [Castilleja foliolosa]|uniref:Uncharacterized protein n=1 Tax=Castilleja foliolosa TaxID=1961234 RepID=A0ABD3BBI1_9LAMI
MANIISMAMTMPKRPTYNNNRFMFDKKTSNKLCFVACINGVATGLTKPFSTFQSRALQTCDDPIITDQRRSGNYAPPIWDFDFIQSLSSDCNKLGWLFLSLGWLFALREWCLKRVSGLMFQMEMMLDEEITVDQQLEFIDDLQRLGISYHFEDKIKHILNHIYDDQRFCFKKDLHSTALEFKILRQYGFSVPQDVFDCFKNDEGDFVASLGDDTKGLLQLYEASFMLTPGEKTLELAREFAAKFLQKKIDNDNREGNIGINDEYLSLLAGNALELPFHWRAQRPYARWFISVYEKRPYNMNLMVLELAKLDFNIVQATHQQELKHVSRCWKQTCLAEKLPFARNRVVESYLLTIGDLFQPEYGYSRIMGTKVNALVTIIDDMFDVYGTYEELQLFNNAIQRWDIEAMDKLPEYMQICFLALNNFVDEMAYHVLKEQGSFIIPHLRKSWANLCTTYLQEAKWYSMGYTPTMEEYISHAWVSISVPVMLCHAYFLVTNPIEKEAIDSLFKCDNIVQFSGTIARLANDLGTSPDEMERGDVPKSIQCYMNDTGASREEAQKYMKRLIYEMWKKMNEERVASDSPLSRNLIRVAVDFGRIALYVYEHGDGYGIQGPQTKTRISSLLFETIV